MRNLLLVLLASSLGCATVSNGERGPAIGPPKIDRCAAQGANQAACQQTFEEAVRFASKLFTDDQICIDGDHELQNTSGCQIRAFVEGTAPNAVELEIRDAPEGSHYKIDSDYWFDHRALADLQCRALGYGLQSDKPIR